MGGDTGTDTGTDATLCPARAGSSKPGGRDGIFTASISGDRRSKPGGCDRCIFGTDFVDRIGATGAGTLAAGCFAREVSSTGAARTGERVTGERPPVLTGCDEPHPALDGSGTLVWTAAETAGAVRTGDLAVCMPRRRASGDAGGERRDCPPDRRELVGAAAEVGGKRDELLLPLACGRDLEGAAAAVRPEGRRPPPPCVWVRPTNKWAGGGGPSCRPRTSSRESMSSGWQSSW